jgi:acyl-CoA reductase-like NAD-dependent aldehyde dehydrogenase
MPSSCADIHPVTVTTKIAYIAFCHSGQMCIAVKRVYVHEAVYDAFLAAIVAFMQSLKVGVDEDTFTGPVANAAQFERVKDLLADVESRKLTVAVGSKKPLPDRTGYYLAPTVINNPPDDARVVTEEQFGKFGVKKHLANCRLAKEVC